ncbi:MAG: radical SAM family heme chaperone HemW [Rhodomicrobium sp.]
MAIYIHWPYCESKCPYCDFNSYARRSISEEQYLEAALRELSYYAARTSNQAVSSVFFGGGTPSLMQPATVGSLLEAIAAHWTIEDTCEITLEANPSSVEAARFAGYRSAGVNRVSIGVQSLKDEQLRFLGRLHSAAEARDAVAIAARHFERVSFDLIYARPGQSEAEWRHELTEALSMARGHLSLYQLTIEPETAFFALHKHGKLRIPNAELAANLYDLTQIICEAAGLPAYEVSNHAQPGHESRHNLTYWRYGDYLGIGPGAHGRFTKDGIKIAAAAIKSPEAWYAEVLKCGNGCKEHIKLTAHEQAEEMVLMGLRLREGISLRALQAKTGYNVPLAEIEALEEESLLRRENDRIRTSRRGRLVLNAITEKLANALSPMSESL